MIERGSGVPSAKPKRVASEPAATLRTTTSSGMISTSRTSCSRMLRRRTKWVGMPTSLSRVIRYSRDPVVEHALAGDDALLLVVEGGGVVLEILDERAGLGPLVQNLGLAFIDAATAGHREICRDWASRTLQSGVLNGSECQEGAGGGSYSSGVGSKQRPPRRGFVVRPSTRESRNFRKVRRRRSRPGGGSGVRAAPLPALGRPQGQSPVGKRAKSSNDGFYARPLARLMVLQGVVTRRWPGWCRRQPFIAGTGIAGRGGHIRPSAQASRCSECGLHARLGTPQLPLAITTSSGRSDCVGQGSWPPARPRRRRNWRRRRPRAGCVLRKSSKAAGGSDAHHRAAVGVEAERER